MHAQGWLQELRGQERLKGLGGGVQRTKGKNIDSDQMMDIDKVTIKRTGNTTETTSRDQTYLMLKFDMRCCGGSL